MKIAVLLLLTVAAGPAAAPLRAAEGPSLLAQLEAETTALAGRALPSVVRVVAPEQARPAARDEVGPRIRILGDPAAATGSTGFVWDGDGHIVAANIPAREERVRVALRDGREVDARVVGRDAESGLAVLQVEGRDLAPLPLGDAGALRPGSWAIALAAGAGTPPAPHLAVVAGTGETARPLPGPLVRLSQALPPGSAGAPVLNARGEVVAVVVAQPGGWPGAAGASYAIAMDRAKPIVERLKAGEAVRRGFLGVMLRNLDAELAQRTGVEEGAGVFVQDVVAGGPAAAAGVRPEDVIVSLDGQPVRTAVQITDRVQALEPGRQVKLGLQRNRQPVEVTVALGEKPATAVAEADPAAAARAQLEEALRQGRGALVLPGGEIRLGPNPMLPGVGLRPGAGIVNVEQLVSVDFQAASLAEGIARALHAPVIPYRIDPELLADEAVAHKPWGMKATNTPLQQVLDQLAAHYGIRWRVEGAAVVFERK